MIYFHAVDVAVILWPLRWTILLEWGVCDDVVSIVDVRLADALGTPILILHQTAEPTFSVI
jgi:hypothetical protein